MIISKCISAKQEVIHTALHCCLTIDDTDKCVSKLTCRGGIAYLERIINGELKCEATGNIASHRTGKEQGSSSHM